MVASHNWKVHQKEGAKKKKRNIWRTDVIIVAAEHQYTCRNYASVDTIHAAFSSPQCGYHDPQVLSMGSIGPATLQMSIWQPADAGLPATHEAQPNFEAPSPGRVLEQVLGLLALLRPASRNRKLSDQLSSTLSWALCSVLPAPAPLA